VHSDGVPLADGARDSLVGEQRRPHRFHTRKRRLRLARVVLEGRFLRVRPRLESVPVRRHRPAAGYL